MDYKEKLIIGAKELGVDLKQEQIRLFLKYMDILKEWNSKMNLTGLDDPDDVVIKHFLDSITCIKGMKINGNEKIIDVGTGAGFPGIPLKIVFPEIKITLLDSLKKRIIFLDHVVDELGLNNVECIHGRAEDYGRDNEYRGKYDCVLARAVSALNTLSEYTIPFLKIGGYFIAQRGIDVIREVEEGKKAVKTLHSEIEEIIKVRLPFTEADRNIVLIRKITDTPEKYPRKAGKPKKKPL